MLEISGIRTIEKRQARRMLEISVIRTIEKRQARRMLEIPGIRAVERVAWRMLEIPGDLWGSEEAGEIQGPRSPQEASSRELMGWAGSCWRAGDLVPGNFLFLS
ncbi:hypothetical protein CTA1_10627 [Colletotrichum tanaceti]|uniref:Uncharacterized protein n=1 Tax=Colletotrichum tanaceti TaxID=1306861 RepID=A0A4V6DHG9_9PEZI|nr:hypothetical protein CTA1_10627 [Colletotrichum tanaceti]